MSSKINSNYLAIDFGTKYLGLAIATNGIITTLPTLKNNSLLFDNLTNIILDNQISRIYIGLCEGQIATLTKDFVSQLSSHINIPTEFVEESVSTIEADEIMRANKGKKKQYASTIDSVAAAVILRRGLGT